ncbi:f-box family protein, partial [Genlisea aurea]
TGFYISGGLEAASMSKVLGYGGVCEHQAGMLFPRSDYSDTFFPFGNHFESYSLQRKRCRISAPFVAGREVKLLPSIEILPDECLFEIFRRLHGNKEKSVCACVSKRWLMLLSSIRKDESYTTESVGHLEPEIGFNSNVADYSPTVGEKYGVDCSSSVEEPEVGENDCHGFLSRYLGGKKATDVRLASIAIGTAARGGLGKLYIRGSDATCGLTNLGLKATARSCPSLNVLSLSNVSSITDEGLCEIAHGCHSLEKLELCHCPGITDKALVEIASQCPSLKSVTLECCKNIGNESLKALGRHCPNLNHIVIRSCPLIGDQGITSLFLSAGRILQKAKLQSLNISDVSLAVIGKYGTGMVDLTLGDLHNVKEKGFWVMGKAQGLQMLKSLSISSCPGTSDFGLQVIAEGCPSLKLFALSNCPYVSDQGLITFSSAAGALENLRLNKCNSITLFGVFSMLVSSCARRVKALSIENCSGIKDLDFPLPIPSSSCRRSLRSLTIADCPHFGDIGLGVFGGICPGLTHLTLNDLPDITDAGILPLVRSSKIGLVKVNLSGCYNVTDDIIASIAELHGKTLEILNLDGCKSITDLSLAAIAENCSVLSELDISTSRITDIGISTLAAAKQLSMQIFSLGGCSSVTGKSLPSLVSLGRTLIGLNIRQCDGISFETIDILLDDLWRCNI